MVKTTHPTVLLGAEVCEHHQQHYNLRDWVSAGDWAAIQEMAHAKGYYIPPITLVVVQFRPLGWTPPGHLELIRH